MSEAIEKLRDDEHYYGEFGQKYLSNSDIGALLKNPRDLRGSNPTSLRSQRGGTSISLSSNLRRQRCGTSYL